LEEQANSSSGGNVSAQALPAEEMSEYEKIRAANMKQKEKLPRQLKRDWRGFKQSEGFVAGGSLKGAKKLRVVEQEAFNTRRRAKELKAVGKEADQPESVENVAVNDPLRSRRTKQDLGTRGKDEEVGQGARGVHFLRDADEEEVDDVEEELEQEVQDDEEVGLLVAGARGPEEKKSGSKADLDSQTSSSSVNPNRKPFKCTAPGCTKRFGRESRLKSHTSNIYLRRLDLRPFNCLEEECGKKFGRKSELENHLRSTHGAPKLGCKQSNCTATFVFPTQLYRHIKKLH